MWKQVYFFGFYTERVSVERCFHTYFSFCDSIFIYYGFLGAPCVSSVLVELYVDGMQFYQQ